MNTNMYDFRLFKAFCIFLPVTKVASAWKGFKSFNHCMKMTKPMSYHIKDLFQVTLVSNLQIIVPYFQLQSLCLDLQGDRVSNNPLKHLSAFIRTQLQANTFKFR